MSETPVADLLDRAADLIEPDGAWCQHSHAINRWGTPVNHPMGRKYAAYCPEGACLALIPPGGTGALGLKSMHDITRFMQAVVPGGSVPKWNDAPERTQGEVVAMMREAAAMAREQGK